MDDTWCGRFRKAGRVITLYEYQSLVDSGKDHGDFRTYLGLRYEFLAVFLFGGYVIAKVKIKKVNL